MTYDDNKRFISWGGSRVAHPVTLTMHHLEPIKNSRKDFGRKFDPKVDPEVLDVLERIMLAPRSDDPDQWTGQL